MDEQEERRARARRPRPAPPVPHARVRAAQAAQHRARARSGRSPTAPSTPASRTCWPAAGSSRTRPPRGPAPAAPAAGPRSSTGSPPRARSTSRTSSPTPGPAAWDDENFGVHLAFFGQTDADVRLRILEGRRSRLEERVDALRQSLTRTRERVDSYTLELQRHGLESVEREVRWLNELIDTERRGDEPSWARTRARASTTERDRSATTAERQPTSRVGTGPSRYRERQGVAAMGSIRVAIVGVGNCASSLVQGVEYYKDADPTAQGPRPDARAVRAVPRPRRAVRGRVRRRRQEGRPGPRARHHARARTTRSRSATCRPPASSCSAATPSTASASTTAR